MKNSFRKNTKRFLAVAILFVYSVTTLGQSDFMIHGLRTVPQSIHTNPAQIPGYNATIGFPGASSIMLDFKNSAFAYKDIIERDRDDSLRIRQAHFLNQLKSDNYLFNTLNAEIFSLGFRAGGINYISLSVSEKVNTSFIYPKDMMVLLFDGTDAFRGQSGDIGGFGLNFTSYHEFALGFAREFSDRLSIGVRAKFLSGLSNIWTKKNDMDIYINDSDTSNYAITATSEMDIYTSLPMGVRKGDNDTSSFIVVDDYDFGDNIDEFLNNFNNTGYAFDVGATYKPVSNATISLSVLDIGKINWEDNVRSFHTYGDEFTFEGLEINDYFNDSTDFSDALGEMTDSIRESFNMQEDSVKYSTNLNTKIYLGAYYDLTKADRLGVLFKGEFFNKKLHPAFSLNYSHMFFKTIGLATNYTILPNSYFNVGFGAIFNPGPFQMYILSDNIYSAIEPTEAKNVNLRFGINFVFGKYRDRKKKDEGYRYIPSFYKTNRALNY